MISVDGFDDPLHDPAGLDHPADHDALDHDQPSAYDADPSGTGTAVGEVTGDDDADDPGGTPSDAEDLTATGPDGERIDLGPADVSSTGDPDHLDSTTAVSADGTSIGVYTDLDGDGTVDQIIDVHSDGSYTLYLQDQAGDWQVGQTGQITADGQVIADETPTADPGHAEPAVFAAGVGESPDGDTHPGSAGGPMVSVPAGADVDGAGYSGQAEQDATGDGTNDTVVLHGADGSVTTATDYDGDGVADQVTVVSPDGTVTVSATDADGGWHTVATGEVTPDGGIVFHGPVAQPDGDGQNAGPVEQQGESAGDLVLTGADGGRHDLGVPDQDLDGDGVPESVAARTQDGHLLIVSDTDHDGAPDQLIEVDPGSGHVVWAQPDAEGNWVQVHTGYVDPDGNLVVDQAPPQPQHSEESERVAVAVSGGSFDAGRATIDANGDGVPDTVAVDGPQGSTLYYQDADGDGVADRAWTSDSTGRVVAEYALDARSGTWTATRS